MKTKKCEMKSNETENMDSSQSTSVFCFGNINWTDYITWTSLIKVVLENQASYWGEENRCNLQIFHCIEDTKQTKLQKSSLALSQAQTVGDEPVLGVHGKSPSPASDNPANVGYYSVIAKSEITTAGMHSQPNE